MKLLNLNHNMAYFYLNFKLFLCIKYTLADNNIYVSYENR